jgi:GAF domain-containing protein
MTSREIVISNDPAQDPRSGGTPEGHPPLKAFMGLPVHHQGQMLAVAGLGTVQVATKQKMQAFCIRY